MYYIDALASGSRWGYNDGSTTQITYSFPFEDSDTAFFSSWFSPESNYPISGLNVHQRSMTEKAFDAWSSVANIVFLKVPDTADSKGYIRITFTDGVDSGSWGHAYYPENGDIWIDRIYSLDDFSKGSYNYLALLHETGHALGLKHSFDDGVVLPSTEDSYQYTLMSYTWPAGTDFYSYDSGSGGYSYESVLPDGPMLYDIAAIQSIYGANESYHTGNNLYYFDPNIPFWKTIWDAGGNDTISAVDFENDVRIDLRPGQFSDLTILSDIPSYINDAENLYDGKNNLAIAFGTVIENAAGGTGNDRLSGNGAANVLEGNRGHDKLYGRSGNDILKGGKGNDVLVGGNGKDSASYIDASKGVSVDLGITSAQSTGQGKDLLRSIENLAGSIYADQLIGNGGDNRLLGNKGSDELYGKDGNDLLKGQAGHDLLSGGKGNDKLIGGNGQDRLVGWGGNDVLKGGAGHDELDGSQGKDRLFGGKGDDTLNGGKGRDVMVGGDGVDTFRFDSWAESKAGSSRDVIKDFLSGVDKLDFSNLDFDLAQSGRQTFNFYSLDQYQSHDYTGVLWFSDETLSGSVDADAEAEFEILLVGVEQFVQSDFVA